MTGADSELYCTCKPLVTDYWSSAGSSNYINLKTEFPSCS